MKKILLSIALVLTLGLVANAQYFNGGNDGFFSNWEDVSNGLDRDTDPLLPALPQQHGVDDDQNAPLGNGLIILGALGAGYASAKRRKE